ncbi:UNVERIFIED_CONTAM: hypothetical protein FKN15_006708 [Acipenser sinensis]
MASLSGARLASLGCARLASLGGARQASLGGARQASLGGARQGHCGPSGGDGGKRARTSGGAGVGPLCSHCSRAVLPRAPLSNLCRGC